MSVEPSPVQDAPTPFSGAPDPEDTNPPSDFILRSSDNVDFHVHKQILAFVSVFFANMFKFPIGNNAPTETERDGKTVLPIPETKDVLYRLLCIAYPARSRQHYSLSPADLDSISAVHEAAHKYQFVQAQAVITEMLMDPVLLDGQPHRLFAIAVLRNIPELARQAALSTLEQPMCPEALAFPEMAQITWETAQKLYEFHHRCGRVAQEIVHMTMSSVNRDEIGPHANPVFATSDYTASHEAFTWWQEKYHHAEECRAKYDTVEQWLSPAEWFRRHIARVAQRVRLRPTASTLQVEAPQICPEDRVVIKACKMCESRAEANLKQYAIQLGPFIDGWNRDFAVKTFPL